jgi:hypothetical protein
MPHYSHSSAHRVSVCHPRRAVGLSQQRDIEGSWEPIDYRAQRLKRFVTVACFDAEPGKVACGIQFEEAGSLLARLCDGALIAEPGLFVMTLCLRQRPRNRVISAM